jgi:hypothetical protein
MTAAARPCIVKQTFWPAEDSELPAKNALESTSEKWKIRGWFFDNLVNGKPSPFGRGRHFPRRQTLKMRVRAARNKG